MSPYVSAGDDSTMPRNHSKDKEEMRERTVQYISNTFNNKPEMRYRNESEVFCVWKYQP